MARLRVSTPPSRGSTPDILRRHDDEAKEARGASGSGSGSGSGGAATAVRTFRPRHPLRVPEINLKEYKEKTLLGAGAFGRVTLVQHKVSKELFAMKRLSKAHIVKNEQKTNIMYEKTVLSLCDSDFILRLRGTAQDRDCLYMLLELAMGGELFDMMRARRDKRLLVSEARFYCACVIIALEHLHGFGICYRDLKPENMMLTKTGYLKLIDFGFAKVVEDGKTYTLVGTPEYMAPEVILKAGHGLPADIWSLGCMVYDMMLGRSPFADLRASDQGKVAYNIVNEEPRIPDTWNKHCQDFITRCLQKDPTRRIGSGPRGITELLEHPWFEDLDIDALRRCELTAPWKPTLKSDTDTSHFNPPKGDASLKKVAKYKEDSSWSDGF